MILLTACFITLQGYSQHPFSFKYNLEKKTYRITSEEKEAVKSHIREWIAANDTIGELLKIENVAFCPDKQTLHSCDSIVYRMRYDKDKFSGFSDNDNGSFFGANFVVRNKEGVKKYYTIYESYSFQVTKVWVENMVLVYKAPFRPAYVGKD